MVRSGRTVLAVLALLTAVLAPTSCGAGTSTRTSPQHIQLETLEGTTTSIAEAIGDRPLLVSLWAVWCQPCRRELPELQRTFHSDAGVDVLAINVGDDPRRIIQYLTEMSLDLPVAIDHVGDLLTALDVGTVPATVLFDTDGTIMWSHLGAVTADQVSSALDSLVAKL